VPDARRALPSPGQNNTGCTYFVSQTNRPGDRKSDRRYGKSHSSHARGDAGDGAGLMTSAHGKRIAFDDARHRVMDGPFAENREIVAGYEIGEVKDMNEALTWARRWPNPVSCRSEIEIRRLFEWQPADEPFV
jgi:hypothetical protein